MTSTLMSYQALASGIRPPRNWFENTCGGNTTVAFTYSSSTPYRSGQKYPPDPIIYALLGEYVSLSELHGRLGLSLFDNCQHLATKATNRIWSKNTANMINKSNMAGER